MVITYHVAIPRSAASGGLDPPSARGLGETETLGSRLSFTTWEHRPDSLFSLAPSREGKLMSYFKHGKSYVVVDVRDASGTAGRAADQRRLGQPVQFARGQAA
jgi:hypothetical protein